MNITTTCVRLKAESLVQRALYGEIIVGKGIIKELLYEDGVFYVSTEAADNTHYIPSYEVKSLEQMNSAAARIAEGVIKDFDIGGE